MPLILSTLRSNPLATRFATLLSILISILTLFFSQPASAHVKWFSRQISDQPSQSFADLNHPTFWFLFLLSMLTLGILVFADRKLEEWPSYRKWDSYFAQFSDQGPLILRVFTGASLLLAWQADTMIAPDLKLSAPIWGWYQLVLSCLLLLRATTPLAGAGMIVLYGYAISQFGLFHLLDYLIYFGIGIFFLVSNSRSARVRDLRIPALYSTLGFSLCWVALEKIFYPTWGLDILRQAPALTMGLDHEFFLLACAFVEFSLGYLLIICLLHRPLALTITLVFFTTTAFFGKLEVVGHTLLHGALLVFIVVGQKGAYRPPITFHKKLGWRIAFTVVNFAILFALLAVPYWLLSHH